MPRSAFEPPAFALAEVVALRRAAKLLRRALRSVDVEPLLEALTAVCAVASIFDATWLAVECRWVHDRVATLGALHTVPNWLGRAAIADLLDEMEDLGHLAAAANLVLGLLQNPQSFGPLRGMAMGTMRRADTQADYDAVGLTPCCFELREDGQRIRLAPDTFEWWYFEVASSDGILVVAFLTKPMDGAGGEPRPVVSARLSRSGGRKVGGECVFESDAWTAGSDFCDVQVSADNFCRRNGDGSHVVGFRRGDICGTVHFAKGAEPVRIGTGELRFENGTSQFLGWVVPVPISKASARLTVGKEDVVLDGFGYHDHNWGDRPMSRAIDHWYWSRTTGTPCGVPVVVIAATVYPKTAYGGVPLAEVIFIRDGHVLQCGAATVQFHTGDEKEDPSGHRIAWELSYEWQATAETCRVILKASGNQPMVSRDLMDARYRRFRAECTVRIGNASHILPGTYEWMHFGTDPQGAMELYTRALSLPSDR